MGADPTTNIVSGYKMLTVNGDVSLANYNYSNTGNHNNGLTAVEILGGDKVPTRRGITVDNDPAGDFNFFINPNQTPANTEFHFKIGADPNHGYANYSSATVAPDLMSISGAGAVTVFGNNNNFSPLTVKNTTITGGLNPWSNTLFEVTATGKVYIGTKRPNSNNNHGNLMLNVAGDINTTALYVTDPAAKWSDFVFEPSYKLMPLSDLESFYKEKHHLPSVPTTKEIQENGNNIAQTDAILLQKIEELTLYIVQQQKEIDALKKELNNKK